MKVIKPRFAVLMDMAFSSFQEEMWYGIRRYLDEAGCEAVFFGIGQLNWDNPEDRARREFPKLISPAEFDGAIVVSGTLLNKNDGDALAAIVRSLSPLPVVSIGPSVTGEKSFCFDSKSGIRDLVRHLINVHGYRSFAFVSGPLTNEESRDRLTAFRETLDEAGIAHGAECEFEGSFMSPSGYDAVRAFYDERGLSPRVIVCANDFMAIGVWDALRDRGLIVPYDVAVTGYDDSRLLRSLTHQFTTVRQSFDTLSYLAAQWLHGLVTGLRSPPAVSLIPTLVVRGSCGCLDASRRGDASVRREPDSPLSGIRDTIESPAVVEGGAESTAYRAWSAEIHRALRERRSPLDMLAVVSGGDAPLSREIERSLLSLYASVLEETSQLAFAEHWREAFYSIDLRVLVDHLAERLAVDMSLSNHDGDFAEIVRHIGAKSFHLIQFANERDGSDGAKIVYSTVSPAEWVAPVAGAWFPPKGSGSFVANMITHEDRAYGYFLLDSDISVGNTFDYLRVRFCGITRDLINLRGVRSLNDKLLGEISVREHTEKRLKEALSLLEKMSIEDEMTGLYNRRGFMAMAEQQVKYLKRQKTPFFIVYADLDGLKAINDRWGHGDGDVAIKAAAEVLKKTLRDSDIVARMGGDEFTAIVSNVYPPDFTGIMKRLAAACEKKTAELGRPWKLSMSIGFHNPAEGCDLSLDSMLVLADEELYREKQRKKKLASPDA